IARLGPELAAELEPGQFDRWPTAIPAGTDFSHLGQAALDKAESARRWLGPSPHQGLGSNNWAVAPERTVSGDAIFANDMHLGMNAPGIWYENHLVAPDYQVTGVTFPGQPGIISGHNGRVAWGYTNGFSDVQDLYLEDLRQVGEKQFQYRFKDEWLDAACREEWIRVKGADPVRELVVATHHGPIINKLVSNELQREPFHDQPLALQWTALTPDPAMQETLLAMNSARSCAAMYEALRGWVVPTQNVVYADVEGNIAHTHAGRIPVRDGEPALVPVPGWAGEHEWIGYIPFDELPHQHNPESGFIGTANNAVADEYYPYFVSKDFSTGDRAQRIAAWLTGPYKVDLITMQQMQYDTVSQTALEVAARLAVLPTADPFIGSLLAEMTLWDGDLRKESRPAAVYEVFMHQMARLVLAPRLGDLLDRAMGQGPTPILASDTLFSARVREWLENLLDKPESVWFDLGHGEKRDDCMRLAMQATVAYLRQELGEDPAGWQWGALHKLHFAHSLGTQPPLDRIFNRGPYPYPGDATTLHASGGSSSDLRATGRISAPFRFIVDMGRVERAWGQLVPGQSGHPASRHYADQIKDHLTGFYHPMWFTLADVESNAVDILQLQPRF
ncbi:MAG: penicillin acylase family protein, partial [Anaerolineales bacterium]|nr:penicillin acylase family protein [Anaerolineales bacterium]